MTDQEAKELKKAKSEYHRLLRRLCNPTMYSIFCNLADRAENDPDGICWPSYETIMEDTNSYNRNINKQSIAALVELGVLEVGKRGRSNTYKPAKVDSPNSIILIRLSEIKQSQDDTGNRINMIRKSVSKRYSNDSQRTTPKERITLAKASGAKTPPPPKPKPQKQVKPKEPNPPNPDAIIAIEHWATLAKTRPKGADNSWFEAFVGAFPLDRALAGLSLAKELGQVEVVKQIWRVTENMSAEERAQFDDKGKRIRSVGNEYRERRSNFSGNGAGPGAKSVLQERYGGRDIPGLTRRRTPEDCPPIKLKSRPAPGA